MELKKANIDYYDSLDTGPARMIPAMDAAALKMAVISRTLGTVSGADRVLEVGCGTGWLSCRLAASGFAAFAVGMDISHGMLAACRDAAELNGLAVRQVRGDGQKLPFRNSSFDFICSGGFLHHLENEQAFFDEAHRLLAPGGVLLLFREPQRPGSGIVQGIVRMITFVPAAAYYIFKKRAPVSYEHETGKIYTAKELRAFGEKAGFTVVSIGGHSFLHSIHWYLSAKFKSSEKAAAIFRRLAPAADFLDEKILKHILPRPFFYEISACYKKRSDCS